MILDLEKKLLFRRIRVGTLHNPLPMATAAGAGGDVHRVLYDAVALCSASCAEMTTTNHTMKGAATPVTVRLEEAPPSPPDPPAHRLGLREPDFERRLYDLMATAHRLLTSHSHICSHSRDGRLRGKEKPPSHCTVTGSRDLKLKLTDFKPSLRIARR